MLLLIVAPPVVADHCDTGITIHGRPAFTPGVILPPTPRACLAVETSGSTGHVLLPGTDEIFVRVQADLGGTYPHLVLRLDGLGFRDQVYHLTRTLAPTGTWVYDLPEWLALPAEDANGTLRATVRFPGHHEASAEYTLLAAPSVGTPASEAGP